MSAKDNFNKAMFDMFGVGKDEEAAVQQPVQPAPQPQEKVQEKQVAAPVKAEPVQPTVAPKPIVPVTYLAPGTAVEGKLDAKGDVEIAGSFKGDINATGKVTIHSSINGNVTAESLCIQDCSLTGDVKVSGQVTVNKGSVIKGNIFAGELFCSGQVKGDLNVKGHSAFDGCAVVEGNIVTQTMTMARGSRISGALTMGAVQADKK